MKKGLVNIAQGTPEQLSKVKVFLANSQVIHKGLKTHADAVVFAIEQAERVPELEKENKELRKRIEELEKNTEGL
jgi:hypothetical protein